METSEAKVLLFERIFYTTNDRLFGFIKSMLRDESKVEDCMQQCYMKLWEVLDTIDTEKEVLPLLYTYSRNLTIDSLRRNARYVWVENLSVFSEQIAEEASADEPLYQKEHAWEVDELLKQMPPRRREVFKLVKLYGFTYKEAAAHLNIALSTVEKHMHEAYKFFSQESTVRILLIFLIANGVHS